MESQIFISPTRTSCTTQIIGKMLECFTVKKTFKYKFKGLTALAGKISDLWNNSNCKISLEFEPVNKELNKSCRLAESNVLKTRPNLATVYISSVCSTWFKHTFDSVSCLTYLSTFKNINIAHTCSFKMHDWYSSSHVFFSYLDDIYGLKKVTVL